MRDCPFCGIVAREDADAREVFRDDRAVAFFPMEPATLGHTLLIPRAHIPNIWTLSPETAAHLARIAVRLAHAIRSAMTPEGLNVIQSNGAAATQTVDHLHVHLVPRWTGDAVGRIWPPETNYSEVVKDEVMIALRKAMSIG
jgi:histidine triad (HIT) family protein